MEDLDFTDDKWMPPTMKVRVDKITGAEQRVIEEYMGCPLGDRDHPNFSVGKFNLALAYVMLRRRDPSKAPDDIWREAALYHVEPIAPGQPTPTPEGDSAPKSPSPDISTSPSVTSVASSGGSGTSS